MTTWQSCDCYLPPVNGPFLCLTFFSYAFAPLFLFLISIFPFTFLSLLFLLFLPFFLSPFLLLVFCSSAKPLLNPRTIRGFYHTKKTVSETVLKNKNLLPKNFPIRPSSKIAQRFFLCVIFCQMLSLSGCKRNSNKSSNNIPSSE